MWNRLLKLTHPLRSGQAGGDGAVDVPVRVVLAALALGLLVGAIASRPRTDPSAAVVGVGQSIPVEEETETDRPAIEDRVVSEAGGAGS